MIQRVSSKRVRKFKHSYRAGFHMRCMVDVGFMYLSLRHWLMGVAFAIISFIQMTRHVHVCIMCVVRGIHVYVYDMHHT